MHEAPARAERARVLLGRHRARAPRIAAAENRRCVSATRADSSWLTPRKTSPSPSLRARGTSSPACGRARARPARAPRAGRRRLEGSLGRRASVSVRDTSRVSRRHGCANRLAFVARRSGCSPTRWRAATRTRRTRAPTRSSAPSRRTRFFRASVGARCTRRALQPLASRPLRGFAASAGRAPRKTSTTPGPPCSATPRCSATTAAPSTRSFRAPRSVVSCTPPSRASSAGPNSTSRLSSPARVGPSTRGGGTRIRRRRRTRADDPADVA